MTLIFCNFSGLIKIEQMPFFKWFPWSKFLRKKIILWYHIENYWINLYSKNTIIPTTTFKDINDFQIQLKNIHGKETERSLAFYSNYQIILVKLIVFLVTIRDLNFEQRDPTSNHQYKE